MRRLYVTTIDAWKRHKNACHPIIGMHCLDLITYTSEANAQLKPVDPVAWEALPEVVAWRAAGSPVLMCTSWEHSEAHEDRFNDDPDVAILPHPTFEGTDKLKDHLTKPKKKLKQKHLDLLTKIGVKDTDTVWDVSDKASAICGMVKLRPIL